MNFSFETKVALHGFHIYKNETWENVNLCKEISVQLETNEDYKKSDPYCCAMKTMASGKLEIVGHIPREVSRHTYFCIKEEGTGSVLSTCYRPSPIPSGGLEIRLVMNFGNPRYITHQKMKDFMTKRFCYDHKPVTENVESDLDSEKFHIEIKENVVEEVEGSKVVVAPEAEKGKVTIPCNSDDSDREKEKTQKKTTFEYDSDDAIPESVSKLNKIVYCLCFLICS